MENAIAAQMRHLARESRNASRVLARLRPELKNQALIAMADGFLARTEELVAANGLDLEAARAKGLSDAMVDRLVLNPKRIAAMAEGVRQVASLPDPVGSISDMTTRPNGIQVGRMRVPIGVIGIIYESRPNVTADAASLCLKSGNACILRGGSEAIHSNGAIARVMVEAASQAGIPKAAIQVVPTTDRQAVVALLHLDTLIDLIIPRGGKSLIETVVRESRIQVIKHYDGICHVYVDRSADQGQALKILVNSKAQRTGVCNAAESLLVHRDIAPEFLPKAAEALAGAGVEMRASPEALPLLTTGRVVPATEEDFRTEFLALTMAVGVVGSTGEAIAWINDHGSQHTDTIVTQEHSSAMRFLREVDSACCHVNCSTRFSDGGEYGLGCEIGISTDKLHARGPMGLVELTSQKWIVFGDGQVRG
jgi:glutamate-5-semialdehyde dehydrogenase